MNNQITPSSEQSVESKASVHVQEPQQVNCVERKLKCNNCGKANNNDNVRIAHNHLMEKCHLLRDIVSIGFNDHRSADPNKELKVSAAEKLKALIEEF